MRNFEVKQHIKDEFDLQCDAIFRGLDSLNISLQKQLELAEENNDT